ncbi:uncharacterized protein LOC134268288 [Saccostrea cucullata]|uniref:uncharacterized protein LOC134268288 n=1 Tax=Saccostrea cuccullata TaxID=36930 RepID=UPI002ED65FF0
MENNCTVGDPLSVNGTIVSCQRGFNNCPAPYRCQGGFAGIPQLGPNGQCCKDLFTLLCGPCIKFHDIHYKFDENGSWFNFNLSFKWNKTDCRDSAYLLKWDPFIRVLVRGADNETDVEKYLYCRRTERPCGKFFSMKIRSQKYDVLFRVEIAGSSNICKDIEIVKVTPPPSKSKFPTTLIPHRPRIDMRVVILSVLGVIVASTVGIYLLCCCMRGEPGNGEESNNREPSEDRPIVLHEVLEHFESVEEIFVVSLSGVGLTLIRELENQTGMHFLTIDQFQEDIFHNSIEWIDNVELKFNTIMILLTANLVNDNEDHSNPLDVISKQLFRKLRHSALLNNRTHFYVYLESPSIIQRHFPCIRTRQNKYDLYRGHMNDCQDFLHLVYDLRASTNNGNG